MALILPGVLSLSQHVDTLRKEPDSYRPKRCPRCGHAILWCHGCYTRSQALPDWTGSHVRAFVYMGAVPRCLVPDNLKSGVTKTCRYEPDLNPTYAALAEHYQAAVILQDSWFAGWAVSLT